MNTTDIRDLIENHAEAVLTQIRDDPELTGSTFEGDVAGNPERYVNVWHDTGRYDAHAMDGTQTDVEVTFTIHSVGQTRAQAVWASGRVTAQLLNHLPTVPGRRCWRIRHVDSKPVEKDTKADPPKFFSVDRFTLRSVPA